MKELEFKFQGLRQIDNYNYLKKKKIKILKLITSQAKKYKKLN